MSNATPPNPGFRNQSGARTVFRVLGVVAVLAALGLMVTAGMEFFTLRGFEEPTKFWMFFVGIPLLAVGGWLLQAGFMGAGARYASGELSPVAKDTAHYLTDGKGLLGVGASPSGDAGPYCRSCGTRNDADARFCDSCGTTMA
ncbi:MAG: zinc ribbon domain-containing protein [Actinomycetes bacterium]